MLRDESYRVLVVDDEQPVHEMFADIFPSDSELHKSRTSLEELEGELFSDKQKTPPLSSRYDLTHSKSAEHAVQVVCESVDNQDPFSVIFMDMQLPPGKNGLWAAERIRKLDHDVNIVIFTGYSDIGPAEINARVPPVNKLLYINKPAKPPEIRQIVESLTGNWVENRRKRRNLGELKEPLIEYHEYLNEIGFSMHKELLDHSRNNILQEKKSRELKEIKKIVDLLVRRYKGEEALPGDKLAGSDNDVLFNILELTSPFIHKLESSGLDPSQLEQLKLLANNLHNIVSPVINKMAKNKPSFTPTEIRVANLIRMGKTTKEIAMTLDLSTRTIEHYRLNIRKKFGLGNKKVNLRVYLLSLK